MDTTTSIPEPIPAVASSPCFSRFPLPTMRLLYKILMFSGISTVFYYTTHATRSPLCSLSPFSPLFVRFFPDVSSPPLPTIFFHHAIDVLSLPYIPFLSLVSEHRLNSLPSTVLSHENPSPLKVFSREDVFNSFLLFHAPSLSSLLIFLSVHIRTCHSIMAWHTPHPSTALVSRICIWKFG